MREATEHEKAILHKTGVWGDGYTLLRQDICLGKQEGIIQQWKIKNPIGMPQQVITITDRYTLLLGLNMPAILWMKGSDEHYELLRG